MVTRRLLLVLILVVGVGVPMMAHAMGGTLLFPDGTPAAWADVTFSFGGEDSVQTVSDGKGLFEVDRVPEGTVSISVTAPDGSLYVASGLPAALFDGNGAAIVLQAQQ